MATNLTIEDAWAEMADGLHIQRWFLETRPDKLKRIERMLTDRGVGAEQITAIRASLPDGIVEHFLDPRQPVPLDQAVEALRFSEMASSLGGAAVLLVPSSACVPGAVPLIDRSNLPAAAIAPDPSFNDDVLAVLDAASTGYLSQLNTRVVVEVPLVENPDTDAYLEEDLLLDTVIVPAGATPYAYAEDLAARSAARFWFSFLFCRPDNTPPPPKTWRSPWSKDPRSTYAMYTEITAKAVRYRMRDRISRLAPELMTNEERSTFRASLQPLHAELLSQETMVDQIEQILCEPKSEPVPSDNNMDVGDIVCTLFPGKNQWHKYWRGGCAGQAE